MEGVRQKTLVPADRCAIFTQQIFFQYAAVTKQPKVCGSTFFTIFLAGDVAWAELTGKILIFIIATQKETAHCRVTPCLYGLCEKKLWLSWMVLVLTQLRRLGLNLEFETLSQYD